MTFEERCIAHYGKVETRVGKYPAKRPIVIRPSNEKLSGLIKVEFHDNRGESYEYDDEGIQRMMAEGLSFAKIADHYCISHSAMVRYARKQGWQPGVSTHQRSCHLKSFSRIIKAMWLRGASNSEIGREIGFQRSTVQKFIKRAGWQRP